MEKQKIIAGDLCIATIGGKKVKVWVTGKNPKGGWNAQNLKTRRIVVIKDDSKLEPCIKWQIE